MIPIATYPPAGAALASDALTVSRFLKEPDLVARRLRTILEQRYSGDVILTGRETVTGGSIGFEQSEGIFADRNPQAISPGGEYPLTTTGDGTAQLAPVTKWGEDTIITDEAIARRKISPVDKAMTKMANTVARLIDTSVMSVVASSVTQNIAASATWTSATPKILGDILRAASTMRALNQGYEPDTLLLDDFAWAGMAADPALAAAIARENATNAVYTGRFEMIAGLKIVRTNSLPAANTVAWLLDSTQIGGIATEDLGGDYQAAGDLVETKIMRDEHNDGWRLRARANFVPYVTEPNAGIRITGVQ